MKYYQELTILPDPEITPYFIWSKLFTQLHIALADIKNKHGIERIGVSFPHYKFEEKHEITGKTMTTLGNKLRVFAPEETDLLLLDLNKWLAKLTDYVHLKSIQPVPPTDTHIIVKRYRYKDPKKQVFKFAKFKAINLEDARSHCRQYKQPIKPYPFITLKSLTNQIDYRLSIWQTVTDKPMAGNFTAYGINTMQHNVTVPHW